MQDVLYEVFETDADLLEGKLVHQGFSRDIAETKMFRVFYLCAGQKDYMLKNHYTQDLLSACLCSETLSKRGECQQ
jgi:hypothetical protein